MIVEATLDCTKCGAAKPDEEFYRDPRNPGRRHRQSWCRSCMRGNYRRWRDSDPSRAARVARRSNLKSSYGITVEQYEALADAQGRACAICRKGKKLLVDHDHATGAVRGLLCLKCNSALGSLGDDVAGLRRALAYLESARA